MRLFLAYLMLLVVTSLLNSVGQLLMRWGGTAASQLAAPAAGAGQWLATSRWWLLGIVVSWFAGLGWAWCLRGLSLGFALPVYTGLVYVVTVWGAVVLLKERFSWLQALGIVSVLIGILLLSLSVRLTPPAHDGP